MTTDSSEAPLAIFTPLDAAHFLGITPELLFAYVRNAPKSRLGHDRRLPTVEVEGHTAFRRSDLEDFDSYLKQPWSESGDERPPIPTYISEYLKVECGGQCPRCGKGFKLENAHIDDYAQSLSHHHHNLIRLCSHCHGEFDSKRILPREQIAALKQRLIATNRERIAQRATGWRNLVTSAPTPSPIFVGREAEFEQLSRAFANCRTVCIQGPAGIGKTELLLTALQRADEPLAVLWFEIAAFVDVADVEFCVRAAAAPAGSTEPKARIGNLLDQAPRCVVFDGVEAITPDKLDDLEDLFGNLIRETSSTKFVFTSQVELHTVDIEARLEVGPLGWQDSLEIIRRSSDAPDSEFTEEANLSWLIGFCDGHALTLRIVAGLLRYFKSLDSVVKRIRRLGTSALDNPTRRTQTKQTSLSISLSLAYTALEKDQQRLLYIVSQCPAGCWTWSGDNYEVSATDAAVAALRRWHLINVGPGQGARRLFLLSPIKAFVEHTYEHEQSAEANEALLCLTRNLAIQALVLWEKQSADPAYGVMRFRQEGANYMHVLYKARERSETHPEYLEFIGALASSLQVFCFVSGLTTRGAEIMGIGAEAALRLDKVAAASGLLLMSIMLRRKATYNLEDIRETVTEVVDLTLRCNDPHVAGNAAMAQAELAIADGELQRAYIHYQAAAKFYKTSLLETEAAADNENSSREGGATAKSTDHDNEHMLSLALMVQGFVLEHTKRFGEALQIYQQAISLMEKERDELNLGSVLHQVGNCNADMGNCVAAVSSYLRAARIFLKIGVSGHLSNSVSEMGYVLIDYDSGTSLDKPLCVHLLGAALADTLDELGECYAGSKPLRGRERMKTIRKLFGVAVAVSFTSHNAILSSCAATIREQIVAPLVTQIGAGIRHKNDDGVPIMYLDIMSALIGSISERGPVSETGSKTPIEEIEHLARLCYTMYDFGWQAFRLFDWLAAYLTRCRHIQGLTSDILLGAIEDVEEYALPFSLPGFEKA